MSGDLENSARPREGSARPREGSLRPLVPGSCSKTRGGCLPRGQGGPRGLGRRALVGLRAPWRLPRLLFHPAPRIEPARSRCLVALSPREGRGWSHACVFRLI